MLLLHVGRGPAYTFGYAGASTPRWGPGSASPSFQANQWERACPKGKYAGALPLS